MANPMTPSDAELLRLMAAGDEPAFMALYGRHQGFVYRFALIMSGAADLAEEVQEVFLALIRNADRYNPARGALDAAHSLKSPLTIPFVKINYLPNRG
jgi:RNA polymerase sigma-70 factor (ECF subfamily)